MGRHNIITKDVEEW